MDSKKPWQSKTIFLNGTLGLVAFIAIFYPPASVVTEYLKAHAETVALAWAFANIILRAVTKDKISLAD